MHGHSLSLLKQRIRHQQGEQGSQSGADVGAEDDQIDCQFLLLVGQLGVQLQGEEVDVDVGAASDKSDQHHPTELHIDLPC